MLRPVVLVFLWLTACTSQTDSKGRSSCELGPAHEVTRAESLRFDGIGASSAGVEGLIAWSHTGGLYVRRVDAGGAPKAAATRVAERCRGGIALHAAATGHWLACSRPAPEPDHSELVLMHLDDQGTKDAERVLGAVGRDGSGVSLALTPTRVLVSYHDGTEGAYAARLSIVAATTATDLTTAKTESVQLSDLTFAAGAPTIATQGEHWLAAFSETHFSRESARTRIVLRSDTQASHSLRETLVPDPTPTVGWDQRSAWLAYRDRSLKNSKPELHTLRLTSTLRIDGQPVQVGRANSEGAPSLFGCEGQVVALLPRDYASERYIGVHWLDTSLNNLGAGHQFYANSRDFVQSQGTCLRDRALIIASERKAPTEPGAGLMAMSFDCQR